MDSLVVLALQKVSKDSRCHDNNRNNKNSGADSWRTQTHLYWIKRWHDERKSCPFGTSRRIIYDSCYCLLRRWRPKANFPTSRVSIQRRIRNEHACVDDPPRWRILFRVLANLSPYTFLRSIRETTRALVGEATPVWRMQTQTQRQGPEDSTNQKPPSSSPLPASLLLRLPIAPIGRMQMLSTDTTPPTKTLFTVIRKKDSSVSCRTSQGKKATKSNHESIEVQPCCAESFKMILS